MPLYQVRLNFSRIIDSWSKRDKVPPYTRVWHIDDGRNCRDTRHYFFIEKELNIRQVYELHKDGYEFELLGDTPEELA